VLLYRESDCGLSVMHPGGETARVECKLIWIPMMNRIKERESLLSGHLRTLHMLIITLQHHISKQLKERERERERERKDCREAS
jgi:hypothetical protein